MGDGLNGWEKALTPVGAKGTAVLEKMTHGLRGRWSGRRWKSHVYMPLVVQLFSDQDYGKVFDVAHTGVRNGDLMHDPLVTFVRTPDGKWYPVEFRNDYVGYADRCVEFRDGKVVRVDRVSQRDLAQFCNQWMVNIQDQYGDQLEAV